MLIVSCHSSEMPSSKFDERVHFRLSGRSVMIDGGSGNDMKTHEDSGMRAGNAMFAQVRFNSCSKFSHCKAPADVEVDSRSLSTGCLRSDRFRPRAKG